MQQQGRFDAFVQEFNTERPHEALGMKYPAELYTASPRRYDGLPELSYPFHDLMAAMIAPPEMPPEHLCTASENVGDGPAMRRRHRLDDAHGAAAARARLLGRCGAMSSDASSRSTA